MQKYPLLGERQLTYSKYKNTHVRLDGLFVGFVWILSGIFLNGKIKNK
jgi:hypothetical protein